MYKKIAIFFLIIALLILGYGVYIFSKNQYNQHKQTPETTTNEAIQTEANSNKTTEPKSTAVDQNREPRDKETLEKEVDRQITVKATKIKEEAEGRSYTDDELEFLTNPRQNVISNLAGEGKLIDQEVDLLK